MCVDWEWTIPCAFVLRTDRDEGVRREGRVPWSREVICLDTGKRDGLWSTSHCVV